MNNVKLRLLFNGMIDEWDIQSHLDQMERNNWKISPLMTYEKEGLEIKLELREFDKS